MSAPSGSGKTTLVKHLLQNIDNLEFSVSATSRKPRDYETNGKDYFFVSADEFKHMIESNEFIEWQEVYSGVFYGSLSAVVDNLLDKGTNVIFDVDVVGGLNIKKHYGDRALAIFVKAKSLEVIRQRLLSRSTETEQTLKTRLEKTAWEMQFEKDYDVSVVNDDLDKAKADVLRMATEFLNK